MWCLNGSQIDPYDDHRRPSHNRIHNRSDNHHRPYDYSAADYDDSDGPPDYNAADRSTDHPTDFAAYYGTPRSCSTDSIRMHTPDRWR